MQTYQHDQPMPYSALMIAVIVGLAILGAVIWIIRKNIQMKEIQENLDRRWNKFNSSDFSIESDNTFKLWEEADAMIRQHRLLPKGCRNRFVFCSAAASHLQKYISHLKARFVLEERRSKLTADRLRPSHDERIVVLGRNLNDLEQQLRRLQ